VPAEAAAIGATAASAARMAGCVKAEQSWPAHPAQPGKLIVGYSVPKRRGCDDGDGGRRVRSTGRSGGSASPGAAVARGRPRKQAGAASAAPVLQRHAGEEVCGPVLEKSRPPLRSQNRVETALFGVRVLSSLVVLGAGPGRAGHQRDAARQEWSARRAFRSRVVAAHGGPETPRSPDAQNATTAAPAGRRGSPRTRGCPGVSTTVFWLIVNLLRGPGASARKPSRPAVFRRARCDPRSRPWRDAERMPSPWFSSRCYELVRTFGARRIPNV